MCAYFRLQGVLKPCCYFTFILGDLMRPGFLLIAIVTSFAFLSFDLIAKPVKFVGVQSCSMGICHGSKKTGDAFKKWKSTKHSGAYDTLGTARAKELAKTVNVTGDPQQSIECLICHSAGAGVSKDLIKKSFFKAKKEIRSGKENGVQCENCHGPGSLYKNKMKKLRKERLAGGNELAKKYGLTRPTEQTCKQCHVAEIKVNGVTYKNPAFKPFDYKERVKKILHPMP